MFNKIFSYRSENSWDKLLNIRTTGRDDLNANHINYAYEPTPYSVLERLKDSGRFGKKNTLIDYGAGKGRVSFFMSHETGCRSIGVEYNERLYEKALKNQETAVSGNKVNFILQNASRYKVPAEADRFFFFNPFSLDVLRPVMERIRTSFYEAPRELQLFFYFPSLEYMGYLSNVDELNFEDEIGTDDLFFGNQAREKILIFTMA